MKQQLGIRCEHPWRTYHRNQADEIIAWACDACHHTQAVVAVTPPPPPQRGLPATVPQLTQCEWCGDDLRPDSATSAFERWLHKRYCDRQCYSDDLEDRRETGRKITCPDTLKRGYAMRRDDKVKVKRADSKGGWR